MRQVLFNDFPKRGPMTKRTLLVGVVAGAAAGLAMAAVEMIYGWASSAHTAWDAPMGIWAYIGGLTPFRPPADPHGPILLGIGGPQFPTHLLRRRFLPPRPGLPQPPRALQLLPG